MNLIAVLALGLFAAMPRVVTQNPGTLRRVVVRDTGSVPVGSRPPAGMCRIWLDDVPVSRQPAPTDCASAVRNRPPKGRVVFGDDYVRAKPSTESRSLPFAKGFAPPAKSEPKKKPVRRDTL